jgi:hypothetical protein
MKPLAPGGSAGMPHARHGTGGAGATPLGLGSLIAGPFDPT